MDLQNEHDEHDYNDESDDGYSAPVDSINNDEQYASVQEDPEAETKPVTGTHTQDTLPDLQKGRKFNWMEIVSLESAYSWVSIFLFFLKSNGKS